MPYIPHEARLELEEGRDIENVGELTYVLYSLCVDALPTYPRFADLASVLGALEATKAEFLRRHVAPYEDMKCISNGDVP